MELWGRTAEEQQLLRLIEQVEDGRAQSVVIEAPAGLGKSSLITFTTDAVADRPAAWGTAVVPIDDLDAMKPMVSIERALTQPGSPVRGRAAAIEAVESAAAAGPFLLAVDDAHLAHPQTLDVVAAVAERLADVPLLLVVAARPEPRTVQLTAVLEQLEAAGSRCLPLEPLDDQVVADWVRSTPTEAPVDVAEITSRAGGNPLLVEELLRSTQAIGPRAAGEAPTAGLRRTVVRRLFTLDDPTAEVVRAASVLGRETTIGDLAMVTGRSTHALVSAVERAQASGLLVVRDHRVSFRHDVVRDAIYEELSDAGRAALHLEVAQRLSDAGVDVREVVPHLVRAAGCRDPRALALLTKTAWAVQATDRSAAVSLFERALELVDARSADHTRLQAGLVSPLVAASRQDEAIGLARAVLQEDLPADLAEQVRASLLRALHRTGDLQLAIEEGRRLAPGAGDEERRRIEADIAYQTALTGDVSSAAELAAGVLSESRTAGEDTTAAGALVTIATAALAAGDVAAGLAAADDAAALMRRTTDFHRCVASGIDLVTLSLALLHADRIDDAVTAAQRGLRRELSESDAAGTAPYHWIFAVGSLLRGRWEEADVALESGLAVVAEGGNPLGVLLAHAMSGLMTCGREGPEAARAALAEGHADLEANGPSFGADHLFFAQAVVDGLGDEPDTALPLFEMAWGLASSVRFLLPWTYIVPEYARLAVAAGRHDIAASLASELHVASERAGRTPSTVAAVGRIRAQVEGAPRLALEAAEVLRRAGRSYERARALDEAATLTAAAAHGDVAGLAKQAADAYRGMGAVWFAEHLETRLLDKTTPRRRRSAQGWASLTEAELQVARLVSAGHTKARAAEVLYISPHTVDSHLRHIYAKLGISSRAQLATAVARNDS